MIELRWITRGVEFYPINEGAPMRYEKFLQYRTWTDTTPRTPWQDVPDVGFEPSSPPQGER